MFSIIKILCIVLFINIYLFYNNTRIAFGSCLKFKGNENTDILSNIAKEKPEYFFIIGDAFYLDQVVILGGFQDRNLTEVNKIIEGTVNDPNFKNLKRVSKIRGVWDDHDYGLNNSNKLFKKKDIMKDIYLNFLEEPKDSIRRQKGRGIYQSYYIADRVKVILLDNRYPKDPYY